MTTYPKVLVIILSWNDTKNTLETLTYLKKSKVLGYSLDMLVIDNGSDQRLILEDKRIKVLRNKENLGFAGGNNVGIREGLKQGYDLIALLNNDTIVDSNLIKAVVDEHQKNPKAGAISPKIYFSKGYEFHKRYKNNELGHVIWYAGGDMDWENVYGSNHGVDEVDHGQFNKIQETDFATGCFVMYKAEALEKVGIFDERYFTYFEDVDLSHRLMQGGWKVLYSSAGILWHKVAQSSSIGGGLNDYFLTRNRMLFGMRYASLRTKIALIKESIKLVLNGRKWQKIGIRDFYLGKFGKGTWND